MDTPRLIVELPSGRNRVTLVEPVGLSGANAPAIDTKTEAPEPPAATARVRRLRQTLLNTVPEVCAERARYVTETYKRYAADPPVLRRAKGLAHGLANMTI